MDKVQNTRQIYYTRASAESFKIHNQSMNLNHMFTDYYEIKHESMLII